MRRYLLTLALLAVAAPAHAKRAPQPAASVFDKSGIADWTKPPPPTKEPTFKPPVAKRLKLANGIPLLVIENHALPIVSMTVLVRGAGAAADPAGKGGLAAFSADLLDEGAGGLSAIGIAEETDRLGASIGIGVDTDAGYIWVSTLAKTLDPTLDLLAKVITQPAFDDKEAERVKGDRVTSLELRRDRPREVASLILDAMLYGAGSPYGHPTSGTREGFKTLGVSDARAFYKARWTPGALTIVVAGDVEPKALKAKLDQQLGAWKMPGARKPPAPVTTPAKPAQRLLLVDRKDAAQSDVRIGLVGLARKDKRYPAFEVFRTTLGDGFTSRLTQRLREQLGITYGASASQDYRVARGPFVIGTAIVTPATGQGVGEVLKIVDALNTTNIPADELEKSKQNIIRALPSMFGTNAATAGAFADLALHGLPDNYYATYAAAIRKVTAKDVKAAAKAVVPTNKLVIAIVGDLAKIKPDLDKLGLGEPVMHDLYGVRLETKAELDDRQQRKKQQLDLEVSSRRQTEQR